MLSWEYPPHVNGGLGSHVKSLVAALSRLGTDVHLVTPQLKGGEPVETVQDGVTVHRVSAPSWETGDILTDSHEANRRMTNYAEFLVRNHGPFDLIHAHDWLVGLSASHFKHAYKRPLVATVHATERGRRGGVAHDPLSVAIDHAEWQLCYEAWRIIVTSQYMADQIANFFAVPPDKIDIIPNGVDSSGHQRFDDAGLLEFRRRFADDSDRIVFHIGRLVHEKGAQTLVAAAPAILAELPNVRFVVAGHGPMSPKLIRMASDLRVSDRFDFVGRISDDDRDRLYRVADVAVFPSLYEPFGIVALEAMAAGVPVVASSAGGLAEVVHANETGLTHEPGNPESLAWAVVQTLRHPDQAQARVESALENIRTVFSWGNVAEETMKVYGQVLEERKDVDW
ncbi:MAG: glycosyltransferase family 4 protein [Anaerolineae bacterium]